MIYVKLFLTKIILEEKYENIRGKWR